MRGLRSLLLLAVLIAILVAMLASGAMAQTGKPLYFFDVPGFTLGTTNTPITRASNTTAYTGGTTAQSVCQSTSTTCIPGVAAIANAANGQGFINLVNLSKSSSTTSGATFTIWMFSSPPSLVSPAQQDATAYVGPRSSDWSNGIVIGSAVCSTAIVTSDTSPGVGYQCTLSNPNTSGVLVFGSTGGVGASYIYYIITVTGNYTPAAGETFPVSFSGFF
jgi:hypothetical protein